MLLSKQPFTGSFLDKVAAMKLLSAVTLMQGLHLLRAFKMGAATVLRPL